MVIYGTACAVSWQAVTSVHPGVASAALLGLIFYRLVVEVTLVAHYIVIEEVACACTHPQRVLGCWRH